jgi:hypothetical protein
LYWLRIEFKGMLSRSCNKLSSFMIRIYEYIFKSPVIRGQQMFAKFMTQPTILLIRHFFTTETASIHAVVGPDFSLITDKYMSAFVELCQ